MDNKTIFSDIHTQYSRAIGMFRDAINLFPDDEWKKGDLDYLRPAGVAYHTVECIDFYSADMPPDKFPWSSRFGIDWETKDSEKLPDRQQVLAYLDDMESRLEQWFDASDLSAEETIFPWTGKTLAGRAAYGARHVQHHLSEMALELTRRGYAAPDWR